MLDKRILNVYAQCNLPDRFYAYDVKFYSIAVVNQNFDLQFQQYLTCGCVDKPYLLGIGKVWTVSVSSLIRGRWLVDAHLLHDGRFLLLNKNQIN